MKPPEPPEREAPDPTHRSPEAPAEAQSSGAPSAQARSAEAEPAEEAPFSEFFHTDELPARGERAGSHRGAVDVAPYFARLLAPATAVLVVIVVIGLLIWINGSSSGPGQPAALQPPSPAASGATAPTTRAVAPTTRATHRATTPAHRSTHHHPARPAAPPPTHRGRPVSHTKPASRAKQATISAMAPVTVLNNSRRTGLAHAAAGQIRAKGWKIGTVGNLQGLVPASTVFYAPGEAAAARHLAHDFGSIQRIEPNHAGHMHGSALTLVVTANWRL
jgi:hypothetical protein